MTYKTIIVNLGDVERLPALMDSAVYICSKFGAHLIGLHVIPPFNMAAMAGPFGVSPEIVNEYIRTRNQMAEEIKLAFEKRIEQESLSTEWRCVDAWSNWSDRHLIKHARCADLIISDQGDVDGGFSEQTRITEHLILESGRPVLVVPFKGSFMTIGDYPMIAWNASQEAARAVFDAMPVLTTAKEVKVVWIDPYEYDEQIDLAGSEISTTLARHGIKVEAESLKTERKRLGDTLTDQVHENGADLLVMGAYGHSRFQEYMFGGATRGVLKAMTTPVLFSH